MYVCGAVAGAQMIESMPLTTTASVEEFKANAEPEPTGARTTASSAIRQPARVDQHWCAACLLQPQCHTRAPSAPHFDLDI